MEESESKRRRVEQEDEALLDELLQAGEAMEAQSRRLQEQAKGNIPQAARTVDEQAARAVEEEAEEELVQAAKAVEARIEASDKARAQGLLKAMATADDLAGQWHAAVKYVRQHATASPVLLVAQQKLTAA